MMFRFIKGVVFIFLNRVIGDETRFSMKHRILNIILSLGAFTSLCSAILNFFLQPGNPSSSIHLAIISLFLAAIYYLSYFKKMYRSIILMALLCTIFIIPSVWIDNGGMNSHVPLYITMFVPMTVILLGNIARILTVGLLILITNLLVYMEYLYPPLIKKLSINPHLDFAVGMTTSITASAVVFSTILQYYDREVLRAKEHYDQKQKAQKDLLYLSSNDNLTHLHNRRHFEAEMRRIEDRPEHRLGIIFIDIDGLKFVNDTLGHYHGDKLLLRTAQVLRLSFPSEDFLFRIGGDEFVAVMLEGYIEQMERYYERINFHLNSKNIAKSPLDPPLCLSIGYATGSNKDLRNILRDAENNMYREKLFHHSGDNRTIMQSIKQMVAARDFDTENHCERLETLMINLASACSIPQSKVSDLLLFAKFHDIGKIGIPDHILLKPGPLTEEERQIMRQHAEIGWRIAKASPELLPISDWILKHHECWDGGGYPFGQKGEEIPFECRMLALADSYDAMVSDRPYRKAMSKQSALAELKRCSGTQFDPFLVKTFISIL
jgi:diguanylate cyclase (GGDEF)-like protein